MAADKFIFAAWAESAGGLKNICNLAESIRTFGKSLSRVPIRAYISEKTGIENSELSKHLESLDVEIITVRTLKDAEWFYYAGKVYAAAEAEAAAEGKADLLVWLDNDTIFLTEPDDFNLPPGKSFAYCPVMHNRSGSLYDAPPDSFWSRIYEKLSVDTERLFPMITPADNQKIRAYFHIGLLVVRPEKGILRRLVKDFEILYKDSVLAEMCREDAIKRVFLHQTALVGVINLIEPEEMLEFSGRYNYPIFFEKRYGADKSYDSIEDIVTIRIVIAPEDVSPDWHRELSGPPDKIAWLKERLF